MIADNQEIKGIADGVDAVELNDVELTEELRRRHLRTTGRKVELSARLRAALLVER